MGVESVSVAEALSHADTLEISCHFLLEYCYQLWNPWRAKAIQAIEAIQRTFTCKITEVQHLNYWEDCMNSNNTLSRDAVNVS